MARTPRGKQKMFAGRPAELEMKTGFPVAYSFFTPSLGAMKVPILCFSLLVALLSNVDAQSEARLYAVTFYDRQFITIDTNSGAGTLITNLPVSPLDIAVRHGKLWLQLSGSGIERLRQIDAWTGLTVSELTFNSSVTGGEGAMDFAADGTAVAAKSAQNVGTLFRMDPALTNVVPITADGGLIPSLDGLAFDTNGVLYGLSQNAGGFTLYTVNTNTGAMTAVGNLGITFSAVGGAVAGLAFAPDRTLFAAVGNPTDARLYRVNKSTGAATFVGAIGFPGVSGIRFFVPPPGPLTVSRIDQEVRLSWPHVRGGALESATTVTGAWSTVLLPVMTNGPEAFVVLPSENPERYFRLRIN
jgi:hypothetical protein